MIHKEVDLEGGGFGIEWGHTREYCNQLSSNSTGVNGNSWLNPEDATMLFAGDDRITVVRGVKDSIWFTRVGLDWEPDYGAGYKLKHNSAAKQYTLITLATGRKEIFHDNNSSISWFLRGTLKRIVAPGGGEAEIDRVNGTSLLKSFKATADDLSIEYLYDYNLNGKLASVTRKTDTANVRKVQYSYYGNEAWGNFGDLKKAVTYYYDSSTSTWVSFETKYYRYYKPGETGGFTHGLKYIVGPEAWTEMMDAAIPPELATNTQMLTYADNYFEYNSLRSVTKEVVNGGQSATLLAYTTTSFPNGPNNWKYKTVETRPDGSTVTVYSNWLFQVILKVLDKDGRNWYEYKKYNDANKRILRATSAAVQGYQETPTGLEVTLKTGEGKIEVQAWYSTTDTSTGSVINHLEYLGYKNGSLGTVIKVNSYKYHVEIADDDEIVLVKEAVVYRAEASGGSAPAATRYEYEFFPGKTQVESRKTFPPIIPVSENGDGLQKNEMEIFNRRGRLIWHRDALGYITNYSYFSGTGALRQKTVDFNTNTSEPNDSPWTMPPTGGLNLVTDYQADPLGRRTQELGPSHEIDLEGTATMIRTAKFTVYRDDIRQIWKADGYATGSSGAYAYTTMNPVSITVLDGKKNVVQEIKARRDGANRLSSSDSFPQSSYLYWSVFHYNRRSHLVWERRYFDILTTGDGINGTNYAQAIYAYDAMDRQIREVSPGGTITRRIFDTRGLLVEEWTGTNDIGATEADPTGAGIAGNNMVLLRANEYDEGVAGGNGLLTRQTLPVTAVESRVTRFGYDWRDRRTEEWGELNQYSRTGYDNLENIVLHERRYANSSGLLLAQKEFLFDGSLRMFREKRFGVSPTGVAGNALTENLWRDAKGQIIKRQEMNSRSWTKTVYDGAGRKRATYLSFADSDDGASNSVNNDTVIEQTRIDYDKASNPVNESNYQRFHDSTGKGGLNGPSGSQPKARVYYQCLYPDAIGRLFASADYGTHGGTPPGRPDTVPVSTESGTDPVLVSRMIYDSSGRLTETVNPAGLRTKTYFDASGRQTKLVQNYTGALVPGPSDTDKTTLFAYSLDGLLSMMTVKNSTTGDQITRWVFGTTLSESSVASSKLLRSKVYPDSDDAVNPLNNGIDGAYDRIEYKYNRQGEVTEQRDQNVTIHAYIYDLLGRLTEDRVTNLGTGIDGTVRRIKFAWDDLGRRSKVTSYNDPTGGSILNEAKFSYDGFGQLKEDIQAHYGATVGSTPKVSYTYENGSGNSVRLLATTYPEGQGTKLVYGAAGTAANALSRVTEVKDIANEGTLASYKYLGARTFVETAYPGIGTALTYIKQGSESPGEADPYPGLDIYGRIQDQRWLKIASGTALVRLRYGYTLDGSIKWRQDLVAGTGQDEYYGYDGLLQVKSRDMGTLNYSKTSISGTASHEEDWTYDPSGNWTNYFVKAGGSSILNQNRSQNKVNEVTAFAGLSAPVSYDRVGNMVKVPYLPHTSAEHYVLTWDAWNRLRRVRYTPPGNGSSSSSKPSGSSSSSSSSSSSRSTGLDVIYSYDGLFRQITRNSEAVSEFYWNDSWKCVLTATSSARVVSYYGARGRNDLILSDDGSSPHSGTRDYPLTDQMFSTTAVVDAGGSVSQRYRYTAFGELSVLTPSYETVSASPKISTLFHGETQDGATGWYNYGYRFYLPKLGRWPSRDPIRESDNSNLYIFVGNDPTSLSDRLGLEIEIGAQAGAAGHMGAMGLQVSVAATVTSKCKFCYKLTITYQVGPGAFVGADVGAIGGAGPGLSKKKFSTSDGVAMGGGAKVGGFGTFQSDMGGAIVGGGPAAGAFVAGSNSRTCQGCADMHPLIPMNITSIQAAGNAVKNCLEAGDDMLDPGAGFTAALEALGEHLSN